MYKLATEVKSNTPYWIADGDKPAHKQFLYYKKRNTNNVPHTHIFYILGIIDEDLKLAISKVYGKYNTDRYTSGIIELPISTKFVEKIENKTSSITYNENSNKLYTLSFDQIIDMYKDYTNFNTIAVACGRNQLNIEEFVEQYLKLILT